MEDPTTIALNLTFFGTLGLAFVMFLGLFLVFKGTANFRLNFFEVNGKGLSPETRPTVKITAPAENAAVTAK